jgi:hypothetical protein
MERLVLFLCGLWLWLTRKRRATRYVEVAGTLHSARLYLWSDYANRASTRDRGSLLPDQLEALSILERQVSLVTETSRRFDTLTECCRFVTEELTQTQKAA